MPDITADEFEQFKECLEAASCEIVYRLQDVFQGYVVRAPAGSPALPPDLISKLSEFIESIEEDHVMVVGQVQTLAEEGLYGLDRLDQTKLPLDNSYTFDYTGERVNVYIVDSGADVGHKEFEGRAEVVHVAKDIQQGDCIGKITYEIINHNNNLNRTWFACRGNCCGKKHGCSKAGVS
jgi:hypothetical protein